MIVPYKCSLRQVTDRSENHNTHCMSHGPLLIACPHAVSQQNQFAKLVCAKLVLTVDSKELEFLLLSVPGFTIRELDQTFVSNAAIGL